MDASEQALQQLRDALEASAGRQMCVPRDFERLSEQIFAKVHAKVSSTTLKRLWGYLKDGSMPRESTLDILSQFLGHSDWQAFCSSLRKENIQKETVVAKSVPDEGVRVSRSNRRWLWWLMLPVVALCLTLIYFVTRPADSADGTFVLTKGQTFQSADEYLRLFGIIPTATYWDAPLPHQHGIIVWSPQYHHPHWHNEGNADSLCPTITEYWTPMEAETDTFTDELVSQKNLNLYFTVMRTNELRITFMRGLHADSTFTFLGVYRVDTSKSDSTHVVWQRIADRLNLTNLDYLQQLKN